MKDRKKSLTDMMSDDENSGLYMEEQSPVEWLFYKLWDEPKDKFRWHSLLKKAKEKEEKLKDMERMEKQLTAVEWLIEQLEEKCDACENVSIGRIQISISTDDYHKLKMEAKEMEREQMLEVSKAGCFGTFEFEDYYNETYNSERIEQIKSE